MCNDAVLREPYTMIHVRDHFIIQEMCIKALEVDP